MKDSNQLWKEQQARMNQKAAGLDPTETFYGADTNDEAFEKGDFTFAIDDPDVVVQSYTDDDSYLYHCGGFRFPNIPILGPVVTAAKFRGYITSSMNDDANFKIYGNKGRSSWVANPRNFYDNNQIISTSNRPRTTAYVEVIENSIGIGWHEIIGLEDVINEILALPEWTSGNAIVLLFIANTDVSKLWMITTYWENTTPHPRNPQLVISWEEDEDADSVVKGISGVPEGDLASLLRCAAKGEEIGYCFDRPCGFLDVERVRGRDSVLFDGMVACMNGVEIPAYEFGVQALWVLKVSSAAKGFLVGATVNNPGRYGNSVTIHVYRITEDGYISQYEAGEEYGVAPKPVCIHFDGEGN